ncbi:hypothetical protein K435DRAFT_674160, partial [Dendrothele bispora CBS 962.96]
VLPPVIFGPFVPNFPVTSRESLSTNDFVYSLVLNGKDTYAPNLVGHMADVRDVAHAHIAALSAPPVPKKDKRIIISAGAFTWKGIADLIRKERPELKERLPREDLNQGFGQTAAPLDTNFAKDILGMGQYIKWEETVLEALDAALALERK